MGVDKQMNKVLGLLYSRIGYDLGLPKRAVYRGPDAQAVPAGAVFELRNQQGDLLVRSAPRHWGRLWGSDWWILDFTEVQRPGLFSLALMEDERVITESEDFEIGEDILWRKTWKTVAIEQLDARTGYTADGLGWQDCGSVVLSNVTLREVMSHAAMVIGLTDVLEFRGEWLDEDERSEIARLVVHGCEYLAACQDEGHNIGFGQGALLHEIDRRRYAVPGDMPKAATAFARAARFLPDLWRTQKDEFRRRAGASLDWFRKRRTVLREGVYPHTLGAPSDFVPPDDPMTCDVLMAAWAAWELIRAGDETWRVPFLEWIGCVLSRQRHSNDGEGDFHGHFSTFDGSAFTEKAWSHHRIGFNCGAVFPHYLVLLVDAVRHGDFMEHSETWTEALREFAYGYFLPACRANPFLIIPNGYFSGQGLLWFCGLGHGLNGAYAWAAALASEFSQFFDDPGFLEVATGNLQWIAGLNAGLTRESLAGGHHFTTELAPEEAVPVSMIHGIGSRYAGSWLDIPGSICNGFDVDRQFELDVAPSRENDAPRMFTDEDWITHGGAWLSALSRRTLRTEPIHE